MMSYKSTYFVQKCRCWRPAASHRMQGRDAVVPQPFEPLSTALLVQPIAITTESVCIALLCLSQSESLSQLAQLEEHNLPVPEEHNLPVPAMSNSAVTFQTMCAVPVHAINAAQDPEAVPIFVRTRRSPLTLAAAQCARLTERGSTLCLCNTNHPAGPRIRKQDPWELEGHGQYFPPRLPPPQASISYATYGISYATYGISYATILYMMS